MNGAMELLWLKTMRPPRTSRRTIIGTIHHNFASHRKPISSIAIEKRPLTRSTTLIVAPDSRSANSPANHDKKPALASRREDPAELPKHMLKSRARRVYLEQCVVRGQPIPQPDFWKSVDILDPIRGKPHKYLVNGEFLL